MTEWHAIISHMDPIRPDNLEVGAACPWPAWPPPMKIRLTVLPEHRCSYLPDRVAQSRAFWAENISGQAYHALMNAGFRRSGKLVYQPICRGCRQCLPIRVRVAEFKPTKSQRRVERKNADLVVTIDKPAATEEKWELYRRYQKEWHQSVVEDRAGFESFLYESPVQTIEFTYRDRAGALLAVGICDVCPQSLSSVYFYFDPEYSHRSLGVCGVMRELAFAAENGIPHYYLGYWVDACPAMMYKKMYRSHDILHPDNVWRTQA